MNEMKIIFMDETEKTYSIIDYSVEDGFIFLYGKFKRHAFRLEYIRSYEYTEKEGLKK